MHFNSRRRLKVPSRKGFGGIDAAIIIGFIMFVLLLFGPNIINLFANAFLGGANGAYQLLIELPTWDPSVRNPTKPSAGASPAQWVGYAAHTMSGLMQNLALSLLAIVLIIAAMCYIFETFRFMNEGTAMNIILNSAFTLIMVFAVPYIYNGAAHAINYLTGWYDVNRGSGYIISGGNEIKTLIDAMGLSEVTTVTDAIVRAFGSIVIFIITVSILFLAVVMGCVRLLLVGCLAAALPLLLMLRLIPPVKHLADSLIETVIGIMFASIIAAILIHFGYILVSPETSLAGLTKMIIALATFAGAAYMSTMFAGRLGALFMTMGGMASTASSTATGLMLGGMMAGAGTVAGGITGGAAARGAPLAQRATAALKGAGAGLVHVAAAVLPSAMTGRGPGRVLQAGAGAFPLARQAGLKAGMDARAGTMASNLLTQMAAEKAPGEQAQMGLDWYDKISRMSDKEVGQMFNEELGLTEIGGQFEPEKGGREIKKALAQFKEKPALLDRIRLNMASFKKLSEEEKWSKIDAANKYVSANQANISHELGRAYVPPELEAFDRIPGFYHKVLNSDALGVTGKAAKARAYSLIREGFDERRAKGELSHEGGLKFYEDVVGTKENRKSDEEVADWVGDRLGIHVPENSELKARLGDQFKEFMDRTAANNPLLLDNMRINLEKAGKLHGVEPDFANLEKNADWLEHYERARFGESPAGVFKEEPKNKAPPPSGNGGGGGGGGKAASPPPSAPLSPQPTHKPSPEPTESSSDQSPPQSPPPSSETARASSPPSAPLSPQPTQQQAPQQTESPPEPLLKGKAEFNEMQRELAEGASSVQEARQRALKKKKRA